ncbi:MAG: hypothetical protein K2L42_03275 [Clostridia bacterium]|nr:hypothetical protein [Clostridia bacterium]
MKSVILKTVGYGIATILHLLFLLICIIQYISLSAFELYTVCFTLCVFTLLTFFGIKFVLNLITCIKIYHSSRTIQTAVKTEAEKQKRILELENELNQLKKGE